MSTTVALTAEGRSVRTRSTTKAFAVALPHPSEPDRLTVVLRTNNSTIAIRELEKRGATDGVAYLFAPNRGGRLLATRGVQ